MKKELLNSYKDLSPENFIRTQARSLALGPCYINKLWKDIGTANIVVSRKHADNRISFGFFYLDLYCKGLRKTTCAVNRSIEELEEMKARIEEISFGLDTFIPADYSMVHQIIYGAIQYARDCGFQPADDFTLTQWILFPDSEDIEKWDIEFGFKGKPRIFSGKDEQSQKDIDLLNQTAGPGNFSIVYFDQMFRDLVFDNPEPFDEGGPDPDEFQGRDNPVEENYLNIELGMDEFKITNSDGVEHLGGRVSPRFLFMMCFIALQECISEPRRKEIGKILREIGKWKITDDLEPEPDYSHSEEEKMKYDEIALTAESDPETASYLLRAAVLKYPGNIRFYHLLEDCLRSLNEEELLTNLIKERYDAFPNDVRATSSYFSILVASGEMDALKSCFNDHISIHERFPDRESFSKTEVLFFLLPVIYYYLDRQEILKVAAYFLVLSLYDWQGMIRVLITKLCHTVTLGLIAEFPPEIQDHFYDLLPDFDD